MKFERLSLIGLIGAAIGMMIARDYFLHNNMILAFIIIISCWIIGEIIGVILKLIFPNLTDGLLNSSYWEGVNFMARIFGVMAVIVGLMFLGWGLSFFHNKEYILTWGDKIMYDIAGIFSLSIGLAFFLVEGYYPNE